MTSKLIFYLLTRIYRIVNKTKFILCNSVSEISSNTEYSVEFTAGENKLAMLIILGPDFPMEKPILKITPSISHQWVNENSEIVSAPGYLNVNFFINNNILNIFN